VGGFAYVIQATDPERREKYALKVMEKDSSCEEAIECMRNEA